MIGKIREGVHVWFEKIRKENTDMKKLKHETVSYKLIRKYYYLYFNYIII